MEDANQEEDYHNMPIRLWKIGVVNLSLIINFAKGSKRQARVKEGIAEGEKNDMDTKNPHL